MPMNDEKHNGNNSSNGHDPHEERTDNIIRIPSLAERDKIRRAQEKQWRKEHRARHRAEPIINLPPVTKVMLAGLIGIHLLLSLLADDPQVYWICLLYTF